MCPYYTVRGRQAYGRPRRKRAAAAKILQTRRRRTGLDVHDARHLTSGCRKTFDGLNLKAQCAHTALRFSAGCANLSAQYDGLYVEVQLIRGAVRRQPLARPDTGDGRASILQGLL